MSPSVTISANLRKVLDTSGLSIDSLAAASGISTSTVNRLLSGATSNPGIDTLQAIADAAGVPLSSLLGLDSSPSCSSPCPLSHAAEVVLTEQNRYLRRWVRLLTTLTVLLFIFIIVALVFDFSILGKGWITHG